MSEGGDDLYEISNTLWNVDADETNNANGISESEEESVLAATVEVPKGKQKRTNVKTPPKKRRAENTKAKQNKMTCSVENCMYSTPYPKDLKRHMRKHTGEKPFNCDECSKTFSRYDKLLGHKRSHNGIRPNKCNLCDYAALDAGSLRKHIRIHTNDRPYKCQMCSYCARDSSQLIVHLRHHTGDSPYICSFASCDAAFKTPSDLQRHNRKHTGEKPYICHHCDYRAAVKCNLNAHVKKYHYLNGTSNPSDDAPLSTIETSSLDFVSQAAQSVNNQPSSHTKVRRNGIVKGPFPFQFACKLCSYKGETLKQFQAHMKTKHKNTQPAIKEFTIMQPPKKRGLTEFAKYFSCPTCSAQFVQEDSLRCHMRQHASLGPPPMPVLPFILPAQSEPESFTSYDATIIDPYLIEQAYDPLQLQSAEVIVESVNINVRPQVITFADRKYAEH